MQWHRGFEAFVWSRYDAKGDDFPNPNCGLRPSVGRRAHRRHVATDDYRHQAAPHLVPPGHFDIGCLNHRVRRLDHGDPTARLYHSQGLYHKFLLP